MDIVAVQKEMYHAMKVTSSVCSSKIFQQNLIILFPECDILVFEIPP